VAICITLLIRSAWEGAGGYRGAAFRVWGEGLREGWRGTGGGADLREGFLAVVSRVPLRCGRDLTNQNA